MMARMETAGVTTRVFVVATLLVALGGCAGDELEDVATLEESNTLVDGYVNQATADYATCLGELGIVVSPESSVNAGELMGYAIIDGATFLPDEDGNVSDDTAVQPIGINGANRDQDIRGCYSRNSGAKDVLIDMHDFTPPDDSGWSLPQEDIEAGAAWAECARAAGVSIIKDPNEMGLVVIPAGVTLEQAEMLGEQCSLPMAEDEVWPDFLILGGVLAPDGLLDQDPYARALNGPFLNSEKAKEFREESAEGKE